MKKGTVLITVALMLAFCASTVILAAEENETRPPFNPKMATSGICGDQRYLYVMAAGKVLQYELTGMKLNNTVELPDLPPPPGGFHQQAKDQQAKPHAECAHQPPPPMPQGLWIGGDRLYALVGPFIYRYTLPDLKLELKQELPRPELPFPPGSGK